MLDNEPCFDNIGDISRRKTKHSILSEMEMFIPFHAIEIILIEKGQQIFSKLRILSDILKSVAKIILLRKNKF